MEDDSDSNQPAWRKPVKEILNEFQVEEDEGLTKEEAAQRKRKVGPNKLRETKKESRWKILADQFKSFLVLLLAAAAATAATAAMETDLIPTR